MTDDYKALLEAVQGFNRTTISVVTEGWLTNLLDRAGVDYKRVEHESPYIVVDFSEVPEFSVGFVLVDPDGHKREVIIYFNEFGRVCKTFLGKATK